MGRLDDAADKYEERIKLGEKLEDYRGVAVGKGQLATVQILQGKYAEAAARTAWAQARDAYLAYRKQGGYARTPGGQLIDELLDAIAQGKSDQAAQSITQASQAPDARDWLKVAAPKILAVLQGSRDTTPADDPALDYDVAAEILLLIAKLDQNTDNAKNTSR